MQVGLHLSDHYLLANWKAKRQHIGASLSVSLCSRSFFRQHCRFEQEIYIPEEPKTLKKEGSYWKKTWFFCRFLAVMVGLQLAPLNWPLSRHRHRACELWPKADHRDHRCGSQNRPPNYGNREKNIWLSKLNHQSSICYAQHHGKMTLKTKIQLNLSPSLWKLKGQEVLPCKLKGFGINENCRKRMKKTSS